MRQETSRDTYRGFGLCSLGLLQPRFAGIQVQTPVLQETPLLLRGGGAGKSESLARGRTGPRGHQGQTGKPRPRQGEVTHCVIPSTRATSGEPWECWAPGMGGEPVSEDSSDQEAGGGPSPLTEMVFQSPSRKLRRGVRKLMEAVWIKSLSAAPRRFSASATLISVFPD